MQDDCHEEPLAQGKYANTVIEVLAEKVRNL